MTLDSSMITTCGTLGTLLGGYNKLSVDDYVEKTFDSLPTHTSVRVRATFFKIDAWNNNKGQLLVDGGLAWESGKYSSHGDNLCGNMGYNQKDLSVDLDVTVAHSASSLTVRFTTDVTSISHYWGVQGVIIDLVDAA